MQKGAKQPDAATCSSELCNDESTCSSNSHGKLSQRPPRGSEQQKKGNRCLPSRRRSDAGPRTQLEEQLRSKAGVPAIRDPAKDIARAAARSRPGGVPVTSDLSLVPRLRMTPEGNGFKVNSVHPAAAVSTGPLQFSALEPVEFAIDRPSWRRTLSQGCHKKQRDALDDQDSRVSSVAAASDANASVPNTPSVVTPILTTAQLDADCMEAACAITDYPWHYNFIPAARRAPTGTAGFASTSLLEQERRRSLLFDAHKKHALVIALAKAPMSDDSIPMLQPTSSTISSTRMMGYSRSLSGVAQPQGLPSLEINGHPVSLSPDRPSSAQRVTIG